jgi:hypothetical protein
MIFKEGSIIFVLVGTILVIRAVVLLRVNRHKVFYSIFQLKFSNIIMKTKKTNPIEIEPEVIAQLSEEQSDEIQGGDGTKCSSCTMNSCNTWTQNV